VILIHVYKLFLQAKEVATIVSNASDGVEELVNVGELRPDYVARVVNRYRQELRPDEPVDMDFEVCWVVYILPYFEHKT
jgi:hypothetical protein